MVRGFKLTRRTDVTIRLVKVRQSLLATTLANWKESHHHHPNLTGRGQRSYTFHISDMCAKDGNQQGAHDMTYPRFWSADMHCDSVNIALL